MTGLWQLPGALTLGDRAYPIRADYRDILEIFSYFQDPDLPDFVKWEIALGLFYRDSIPREHREEAMEKLAAFIRCGREERPGPRLLDWDQDALLIIADVNKAAGQEIRALPFVHWWTFLAWFHAVGEGQLSAVVAIRDKLRRGQRLEPGEARFYREHRDTVVLAPRLSAAQQAEKDRLEALLKGGRPASP